MRYDRHKISLESLLHVVFEFHPTKVAHPPLKNAKFRDFGKTFSIVANFVQLFFKNLKKISTAVKNHADCKNTEKTGHPPLKKLIIEKNGLLLDKVTQRCQTFEAGTARVLLGVGKKEFEKSSYTLRKRRKIEKTKKKNIGCQAGLEPSSCVHAASQLEQQLAGTKNREGFCFFLARIATHDAHTCRDSHSVSLQRSLKLSRRVFIFTAREPRKTENLLFIFWFCPSTDQKYSFFQFLDVKFEFPVIFCP